MIGVYFKTKRNSHDCQLDLQRLGTIQVCKYQGVKDPSSPINCTSLMVNNLIIHAEAQISETP